MAESGTQAPPVSVGGFFDFDMIYIPDSKPTSIDDVLPTGRPGSPQLSICGSDFENLRDEDAEHNRKRALLKKNIKYLEGYLTGAEEAAQSAEDKVKEQRLRIQALELECMAQRQELDAKEDKWAQDEHARELAKEKDRFLHSILTTPGFSRDAVDALLGAICRRQAELMVFGDASPANLLAMEALVTLKTAFPPEACAAARDVFDREFEMAKNQNQE